jgi:MinD-like ATPase involved in chromosome partitioning or flagellar assembly
MGERLDLWWAQHVGFETLPVLLLFDEAGLDEAVPGLDAEFVVGLEVQEDAERYGDLANVHAVPCSGIDDLVRETIQLYSERDQVFLSEAGADSSPVQESAPPEIQETEDWMREIRPPGASNGQPGGWRWDGRAWRRSAVIPTPTDDGSPPAPSAQVTPDPRRAAGGRGFGLLGLRRGRPSLSMEIAHEVIRLVDRPTGRQPVTVVFAGVKGGTGNTTNVAAAGALYGEALAGHSRSAGLVDANIVNADLALATASPDGSWSIDRGVAGSTVFELIGLAARGEPFPDPLRTTVPGLAVYPEKPGVTEGYTETQLGYLRSRLGERHDILVVDCAKQWPDFVTSAGITVSSWIRLADVVVVGCQSAVLPMYNVVRFLQAESLQDRRCVVTYKAGRRSAALPEMKRAIADLRAQPNVEEVVEIPEDDAVNVVRIKGKPITEVKANVRLAYVRMAESILRAVAVNRRQRD